MPVNDHGQSRLNLSELEVALKPRKSKKQRATLDVLSFLGLMICVPLLVLALPAATLVTYASSLEVKAEKFSLAEVEGKQGMTLSTDNPILVEATAAAEELGINPSNPQTWRDGAKHYIAFEDAQVGEAGQYAVECSYLEEVTCLIPGEDAPTGE